MDLLYPARLVFHYERLMSLAFAMSAPHGQCACCSGWAARRCGASCAPICRIARRRSSIPTRPIVNIARRWFYLKQPVVLDTAQRFLAGTSARFDVILVDLYGPGGPAESDEAFWARCLDALAPGGCLANNWADFAVNPKVRPMADALSAVARTRGLEPIFVTRRGFPRQPRPVRSDGAGGRRRGCDRSAGTPCPRAPYSGPRPRDPRKLYCQHTFPDRMSGSIADRLLRSNGG